MVTATKKKSTTELQRENILAFNNAVADVKQLLVGKKFVPSSKITLCYGKNRGNGTKWRVGGKKWPLPKNMSFLFRTNKSRSDLLLEIQNTLPYQVDWIENSNLSKLGHLEFTITYLLPEEVERTLTFNIVVKYLNANAFRSLPYTNPLLEQYNWKNTFSNRSPDTSLEHQILKKINDKIYQLGGEKEVDIVMGKEYKNIIGFIPGLTGAHADFVGINKDMEEVCFISHKDGTNAKGFQQYSGISSLAGDSIHNHVETRKFREIIASKEPEDFNNQSFSQDIRDTSLQTRSVLGPEWNGGGNNFGNNNCSDFAQGMVTIRKFRQRKTLGSNATLQIRFNTMNIHANAIGAIINSNEYSPTLGARKTNENRSVTFDGEEVRNVRGGVFSSAYIKGRTNNVDLSETNK